MPRNVFVLIDGTMCSGDTGSNVVRIQETILGSERNRWHYAEGIAAMSSAKWLQTIVPTEINNEAYSIYKTLCAMDVTGDDRLVIIGYSRGAIVARILAQMITNEVAKRDILGSSERARQVLRTKTVDFLGLFDPVRGRPYPFRVKGYDADVHNNSSIKNLYEVVSIDESFVFFKSDSTVARHNKPKQENKVLKHLSMSPTRKDAVVKANREMVSPVKRHFCLFPGVHSDVGGQKGNIALGAASVISMISEVVRAFPDLSDQLVAERLDEMKASLQNHPTVVVGENYGFIGGFIRRTLRRRRKFAPNPNTTVHPLVDELVGRRGHTKAIPFFWFRKYRIPKELANCTRTVLAEF